MFDDDEKKILSALQPEGSVPGSDATAEGYPAAAQGEPTPAPAPASAAPASASTPAPSTAPAAAAPAGTPAPAAAPAASTPAAPAAPAPDAPKGDVKQALRASRAAERRARDEADRLRAENEALRKGEKPPTTPGDDDEPMSPEELAELEENFPMQAKLYRDNQALKDKMAALESKVAPGPKEDEFVPITFKDPVIQEAIDTVDELSAWQYDPAAQDRFVTATQFDESLRLDPRWRGKPLEARFREAVRLTNEQFPAAAPKPHIDPAKAAANAPGIDPTTIGDFRGGAPAAAPARDYRKMSDEAIMASLPSED